VWSFYRADAERQFPYCRKAVRDFGDPKFGTTGDRPNFVGCIPELIGRSMAAPDQSDPVALHFFLGRPH